MALRPLQFDDPLGQQIVAAIHTGDLAATLAFANSGLDLPSIRIVDEHGTHKTLVHVCADWPGHFPNVAELITSLTGLGVPVDEPAQNPARVANGTAKPGETALHWAASSDDIDAVEALIAAGANIEAPGAVFTYGTPMSDAVIFAKWKAAAVLLRHGAIVNGWQAAGLGMMERLEALIGSMTPVEVTGALWHACKSGRVKTTERLIQAGGDLDWVGPMEWTPRRAAQESENAELLALIGGH